jgi:pyridoxine 5-phosphate synthase
MIRLSVNVNKIAVLRNSRGGAIPDVVKAAQTCVAAGCHGITVHPRPDARHIRYQDVLDLAAVLTVEFNIEGYPSPEFLALVNQVGPTQCTLVPDPPGLLTSNAGWRLDESAEFLRDVLSSLRDRKIRSSLFVEPDIRTIDRVRELGADRIELYTGPYAHSFGTPDGDKVLGAHREAARHARSIGLGVNAGHDLDLRNLPTYAKTVKPLNEVSIGHALIADALYIGLARAVRAYLKCIGSPALKTPDSARKVRRRRA